MSLFNMSGKLLQKSQFISGLRTYAFKSDLKIKWVRPEKTTFENPERSGDLNAMPKLNTKELAYEYRNSEELKNADELVRRLFSLELQPRCKSTEVYKMQMVKSVQRHALDAGTLEAKIARLTAIVRSGQEEAPVHKYDRKYRVRLKELAEKRNKLLRRLRLVDYKRFEWIIENLGIVFKPVPLELIPVTRKDSLRKLTQKYCDDIKQERIQKLRKKLEEEQPAFLENKIRTLEFVRDEQKECNIDVTVTEEDINKVKEQLRQIYEKNKTIDVE